MIAVTGLLACAVGLFGSESQAADEPLPPALQAELPGLRAAGSARLTVWGFQAYDARLWVAPGFRSTHFAEHALALELRYLRDFSAEDIARRSLQEMRRQATIPEAQAAQWEAALRRALPDVKAGDRVAGLYRPEGPQAGVRFLANGRPSGEVRDAAFARLFFGIWLAPQTSEPALRQALLAGADASAP